MTKIVPSNDSLPLCAKGTLFSTLHFNHWRFNLTMRIECLAIVAYLSFSVVCSADTWISPDLRANVEAPDPSAFRKVEPAPKPFVALWMNQDESVKLGVIEMPIPPGVSVSRTDMVKGFGEELGVQAQELPMITVRGVIIDRMVAQTATHELLQSVHASTDKLYKVLAVTQNGADKAAAQKFIDSFVINPPTRPDFMPPKPIDTQQISKTVGGAGLILLIVLLAVRSMRRKKA